MDNQASQVNKPEFREWPKIARFNRMIIVTEKIDGTNGLIYNGPTAVDCEAEFLVGSRSRWITPGNDNHGFATWAYSHKAELQLLGPGYHYGEWWGSGIQRGYGLPGGEKRFSLFNVSRWGGSAVLHPERPACCGVVPVLAICEDGKVLSEVVLKCLQELRETGSYATPFLNPEGIVIWHTAMNRGFKVTLENDEKGKNEKETA